MLRTLSAIAAAAFLLIAPRPPPSTTRSASATSRFRRRSPAPAFPNAPAGGGFMTITNTGAEDDRLLSAASDAAAKVELHEMAMEGDVMKMRPMADGIVIPAGETVTLEPGGLHVMFMGLSAPFIEGETVTVTLTFEKAGAVEVELPVGGVSAAAAEGHHGHH
jgi:Uncharacterized protein conserved in bacteria